MNDRSLVLAMVNNGNVSSIKSAFRKFCRLTSSANLQYVAFLQQKVFFGSLIQGSQF